MPIHPQHFKEGRFYNRHFKAPGNDKAIPTQSSDYNLHTSQREENAYAGGMTSLRPGSMGSTATRGGSVYHDAYTGLDDIEAER